MKELSTANIANELQMCGLEAILSTKLVLVIETEDVKE